MIASCLSGSIPIIDTSQGRQQQGRITHRPGHRTGGVLRFGNRDDAGTADQPHRGFESNDPAMGGWRDDRSVGLRAHGDGAQSGRHRATGS